MPCARAYDIELGCRESIVGTPGFIAIVVISFIIGGVFVWKVTKKSRNAVIPAPVGVVPKQR